MKKHNSLFSKILIPFLALSLLITFTFLTFYATFFTRYAQEKCLREFSSETERLSAQISQQYSTMSFASMGLLTRNDFFSNLKKLYYNSPNEETLVENYKAVVDAMTNYSYFLSDYDLIYLDANGYWFNTSLVYEQHSVPYRKLSAEALTHCEWLAQTGDGPVILNLGENALEARAEKAMTMVTCLRAPSATIGYLIVQTDNLENSSVFENILSDDGCFALFSGDGELLYAQEDCPTELSLAELRQSAQSPKRIFQTRNGQKYVLTITGTKEGDLQVVTFYPHEMLAQELRNNVFPALAVTVMLLGLIVMLSVVLSNYLSRPILMLTKQIRETTLDNLEKPFEPVSGNISDEVMYLQKEYMQMRDRLYKTMQDKAEITRLQDEQRYALMQYQINPHFLYNTLNVIGIMGAEHGSPQIEKSSFLLAKLLRYSLQDYRDSASIEEEFESLLSYLSLMKLRFEHKIQYVIDLDPDIRGLRMPRLTLQPLVENVFEHAFSSSHKTVSASIRAVRDGESWTISISDDGQGMLPEKIAQFERYMQRLRMDEITIADADVTGGIGMKNTLWRLRMFFGADFDCKIGNNEAGGCRIELHGTMRGGEKNETLPTGDR